MFASHVVVLLTAGLVAMVRGHGRLVQPPSRSSMWRFGFDNPINVDDAQGFCGGFQTQWNENGGKCGICGDNYADFPRENEAPYGKYANGIIVAMYEPGQLINVTIHLTANHKGWVEYRLCQNNDPKAAVTQDCLDKHLLAAEDGNTRFQILSGMEFITHFVRLPPDVTCKDCVLQWKYNTGNSWGKDLETGESCLGCGPQEQFYACADVAIGARDVTIGVTNHPVTIPAGDVDERLDWEKTDTFDSIGQCVCETTRITPALCQSLPQLMLSNRH